MGPWRKGVDLIPVPLSCGRELYDALYSTLLHLDPLL